MVEAKQHSQPQWWFLVWQRRWWVALATLFILVWWLVPPLLYRYTGTAKDAKLKAITDTRTALLAGLIGVGALLTFRLNSRVYRLTQQGQITERYTKAIEQLGSDKLDVRLGGIYALERIAVDSERDHPTVVEVLSAFVREGSGRQGTPPPKQGKAEEAARKPFATAPGTDAKPRPATDLQAALSVLGRLPQQQNVSRGDLSGVQVAGAQLREANLIGAQLRGANLIGAELRKANLKDAQLREANLIGAQLRGANLKDAELRRANVSGAELGWANLSGAQLHGTDLRGARLGKADLTDARLGGAKLRDAQLHGANLHQAQELTQLQLDGAWGDARTKLPAGLERPASWAAETSPTSSGPP